MIKNLEMIYISLINPRKLLLDSAVKSLVFHCTRLPFALRGIFWSLSVSCLTMSLFRKTSMIEWQMVSNWNRGDTSWKRSFTSSLKLGRGMYLFLKSLRKVFHLNSIFYHLIYCYIVIILHMSVLIEYFTALHFYLSQMIYIFLCSTLYLDWDFSCCVNGMFYHIKRHASQSFGKNVIILSFFFFFLMSYYCMFLIYHVLVFKVNFTVLHFY